MIGRYFWGKEVSKQDWNFTWWVTWNTFSYPVLSLHFPVTFQSWSKLHFPSGSGWAVNIKHPTTGWTARQIAAAVRSINRSEDKSTFLRVFLVEFVATLGCLSLQKFWLHPALPIKHSNCECLLFCFHREKWRIVHLNRRVCVYNHVEIEITTKSWESCRARLWEAQT